MKVLLDEDVPHPLSRALPDHEVRTVAGMGWSGIKNGELLKRAAKHRFEIFVTGDKSMLKQQRWEDRPFAVVVLSAINWTVIRGICPRYRALLTKRNKVLSTQCNVGLSTASRL